MTLHGNVFPNLCEVNIKNGSPSIIAMIKTCHSVFPLECLGFETPASITKPLVNAIN